MCSMKQGFAYKSLAIIILNINPWIYHIHWRQNYGITTNSRNQSCQHDKLITYTYYYKFNNGRRFLCTTSEQVCRWICLLHSMCLVFRCAGARLLGNGESSCCCTKCEQHLFEPMFCCQVLSAMLQPQRLSVNWNTSGKWEGGVRRCKTLY